jgi:hypothetical protein
VKAASRRTSPLPWCLLALAACSTPSRTADFAKNDWFYVDVPFHTKAPGDRAAFVAPVIDARDANALPSSERGFPIQYVGDDFWERSVAEMIGDVLSRQLASSHLFPAVSNQASAQALVIKPAIVAFHAGATEGISGSASFAEVALRLRVFGPAGSDGKRALLHEQTCSGRQLSPNEVNPVSPYLLYGRALQQAIAKTLAGLDGSNVARSNVPIDTLPAEASAPAR